MATLANWLADFARRWKKGDILMARNAVDTYLVFDGHTWKPQPFVSVPALLNFKGQVATKAALPTTAQKPGDIWVDSATNHMWLWSASGWSDLGKMGGMSLPPGIKDGDMLQWSQKTLRWTIIDALKLGDLADTYGKVLPSDGQSLIFEQTSAKWKPKFVLPPFANKDDYLYYDGSGWATKSMAHAMRFRGAVPNPAGLPTVLNPEPGDVAVTQDKGRMFVFSDTGTWDDIGAAQAPLMPEGTKDGDTLAYDSKTKTYHAGHNLMGHEQNVNLQEDGGVPIYDLKTDTFNVRLVRLGNILDFDMPSAGIKNGDIAVFDTVNNKFHFKGLTLSLFGDIDLTTVPPKNGEGLIWDAAQNKFIPGNTSGRFKGSLDVQPPVGSVGDVYYQRTAQTIQPAAVPVPFKWLNPGFEGDPVQMQSIFDAQVGDWFCYRSRDGYPVFMQVKNSYPITSEMSFYGSSSSFANDANFQRDWFVTDTGDPSAHPTTPQPAIPVPTGFYEALGGKWVPMAALDTYTKAQTDAIVSTLVMGLTHGVSVQDILSTPPATIVPYSTYIVGPNPTGAWAGKTDQIAEGSADGKSWVFKAPAKGDAHLLESKGDIYAYNGTAWVKVAQGAQTFSQLGDVDVDPATTADQDMLVWDASSKKWINQAQRPLLADLLDVDTSAAKEGDFLVLRGTNWVGETFDLSDYPVVDQATAPTDGDTLIWNAAMDLWVPGKIKSVPDGDTDDQILIWDAAAGAWIVGTQIDAYTKAEAYSKVEIDAKLTALVTGISHEEAVLDLTDTPPATPAIGDVYIVGSTPTGLWATQATKLARWDGTQWGFETPKTNEAHLVEAKDSIYHFNGTVWNKIATATSGTGLSGIGEIIAWPVATVPTDYLVCDGAVLSTTTYADLYSAIGNAFNAGTTANGTTTFALPDLRGYFLRGAGTNADRVAGGTVGSKHGDSTKMPNTAFGTASAGNHTHSLYKNRTDPYTPDLHWQDPHYSTVDTSGDNTRQMNGGVVSGGAHTHTISGGDTETAPRHISVQWLIRWRGINQGAMGPKGDKGDGSAVVAATAPTTPKMGDLWYDTTAKVLKTWSGTAWVVSKGGCTVGSTSPTAPASGDLWLDSANTALKIWDGSAWAPSTKAPVVHTAEAWSSAEGALAIHGLSYTKWFDIKFSGFNNGNGADTPWMPLLAMAFSGTAINWTNIPGLVSYMVFQTDMSIGGTNAAVSGSSRNTAAHAQQLAEGLLLQVNNTGWICKRGRAATLHFRGECMGGSSNRWVITWSGNWLSDNDTPQQVVGNLTFTQAGAITDLRVVLRGTDGNKSDEFGRIVVTGE